MTEHRIDVYNGKLFLIRDMPKAEGPNARDNRCEYATMQPTARGWGVLEWHGCVEGVCYDDIQPLATIEQLQEKDSTPALTAEERAEIHEAIVTTAAQNIQQTPLLEMLKREPTQ